MIYEGDRIAGRKVDKAKTTPIETIAAGPIWEGDLNGIHIGALPLEHDATFRLPFYPYDKGFGRFVLTVTGSEIVTSPSGSHQGMGRRGRFRRPYARDLLHRQARRCRTGHARRPVRHPLPRLRTDFATVTIWKYGRHAV